jgi:tellurium resistance protein TerD
MAIALKKGDRFNFGKKEPALKKILIGLGWELKVGNPMDLDSSALMIGANGKLPADDFFVFYNNLKSPDGAVQHTGDNRTGIGEGDDEMILANLDLIDPRVNEILIVVSIYDAPVRRHHFGLLKDAYIRILDAETKREVLVYDLDADFSQFTDMAFGKLERVHGEWHFVAIGTGSKQGLEGYVNVYA